MNTVRLTSIALAAALVAASAGTVAQQAGDERALPFHLAQRDLESGRLTTEQLLDVGRYLFSAKFTALDGAGRPGSTGSGLPTRRPTLNAKSFLRTSGPDANACASCHSEPTVGGAGSFTANVFVGAQEREPTLESVSGAFSAERKSPSLFGSGLIELLAREMTADLHAIRAEAIDKARTSGKRTTLPLVAKGVRFGAIGAEPNGTVLTEQIEGIDKDLVVRPWSQKGVVTSLRTFTVTAMNHHHGMQAIERYGMRQTGHRDFDRDGIEDELTEGDISAVTLFQAALPVPRAVEPQQPQRRQAAMRGRQVFADAGCAACHIAALPLKSTVFVEPGPYNLEGTLRQKETDKPVRLDLAALPWGQGLKRDANGQIWVEAFTDLKRHRIADPETPTLANEIVSQGFSSTDEFVTKRLWETGSSHGAYGHRGDITTLHDVILAHGGEARDARLKYQALRQEDRAAVIEFLRTMQSPVVEAAAPPPNVLPAALAALLLPGTDGTAQGLASVGDVPASAQIVGRAVAAAHRAEMTAARIRSLATRIEHELAKLAAPVVAASPPARLVTPLPPPIANALVEQLDIPELANEPRRAALIDALRRAELAIAEAHGRAEAALRKAAVASLDPPALTPTGYVPPQVIVDNARQLREERAFGRLYEEATVWIEDLAFRTEQLGQQVAVAALRTEAFVNRGQLAAATR